VLIEGEYAQALRVAELEWLRGIIDDLAAGRLWTADEMTALFAMGSAADQDDTEAPTRGDRP
jgi:hypothetical protein